MAYSAKIVLDSKVEGTGCRLTTFELTYPRFVHAEFMTHRMFSRNAASSRAIPVSKMIERVLDDPALPVWWGKNQSGMQAWEEIQGNDRIAAQELILHMRDKTVECVRRLQQFGLHKQITNRYLEPWMWITVICSGTETAYTNFFHLRTDKNAQPEIKKIADMACELYYSYPPRIVPPSTIHAPYIQPDEIKTWGAGDSDILSLHDLKRISAARCARVSYLNHDGIRDIQADLTLFERLTGAGHWSPLEHVAEAQTGNPSWSGNFFGWNQFRKQFVGEWVIRFDPNKRATSTPNS